MSSLEDLSSLPVTEIKITVMQGSDGILNTNAFLASPSIINKYLCSKALTWSQLHVVYFKHISLGGR